MTLSRMTLAALATMLCLAAPAAAGTHQIVMKDGSSIPASTRPVIALGRVNYHDENGRSRSLSAAVVNLSKTREALHRNGGLQARTVWTASDLENARRSVHLQTARTGGTQAQSPAEPARQGSVARSSTQAQMKVLQDTLDRVRAQRRLVKGNDPEADTLEERKILLQSELLRLQTVAEVEAEQVAETG